MKIIYEPLAAEKIRTWSLHAGLDADGKGTLTEVGGLGTVRIVKPDTFIITDSFLLDDQVAGATDYTASAAAVAKFYEEFILAGGDPSTVLSFWHSHANMGVFQSSTDRQNVADTFSKKMCCVAVTWNAKGEVYGEVTLFKPFEMRFEKVGVEIGWPYNPVHLAELREKVKPKSAVTGMTRYNGEAWDNTGYGNGWYRDGHLVIRHSRNSDVPAADRFHTEINTPSSVAAESPLLDAKDIEWDWKEGVWEHIGSPYVFNVEKMAKREKKDLKKKYGSKMDNMIGSYGDEDPIRVVYKGQEMVLFSYIREACLGNPLGWFALEAFEEKIEALALLRKVYVNKMSKKKHHGWSPIGEGRKHDSFPEGISWQDQVDPGTDLAATVVEDDDDDLDYMGRMDWMI